MNSTGVHKSYRVDQLHKLLFGLIRYWDDGATLLCPDYIFRTQKEAVAAIKRAVPHGKLKIYKAVPVKIWYALTPISD